MMFVNEIESGVIFSKNELNQDTFDQYISYVDEVNRFMNENEITWCCGIVLNGEGEIYASYENMASLKSAKNTNVVYFPIKEIENFKLSSDNQYEKFLNDNFEFSQFLTERVDMGSKLFIVKLNEFKEIASPFKNSTGNVKAIHPTKTNASAKTSIQKTITITPQKKKPTTPNKSIHFIKPKKSTNIIPKNKTIFKKNKKYITE